MEFVKLHAMGTAIIAQLSKGNWSSLEDLGLAGCEPGAQGVFLLSQGKWPGLQILDVTFTCLDAEGVALLAKGNWPLLSHVNLSSKLSLDAVATLHLSAINWSLGCLILSHMPSTAAMAAELAKLALPNLIRLFLDSASLTAVAVSELTKADWPILWSASTTMI